jgi:hypothetical protein
MSQRYAPEFHVVAGQPVNVLAYDRWVGRWSRLFVPSLLAAAQVSTGDIVLDVSTGTGEAALMNAPVRQFLRTCCRLSVQTFPLRCSEQHAPG